MTREIDPNDPKVIEYFKRVAEFAPPACYCRCGVAFRSHCYTDYNTGARHTYIKCPGCGSHSDVNKISYDSEEFIVRATEQDEIQP